MSELTIYIMAGLAFFLLMFLPSFFFYIICIPLLGILLLLLFKKVEMHYSPYLLASVAALFALMAVSLKVQTGLLAIFFLISSFIKVFYKRKSPDELLPVEQKPTDKIGGKQTVSVEELLLALGQKLDTALTDIKTSLIKIEDNGHSEGQETGQIIEKLRMEMKDLLAENQQQMNKNYNLLNNTLKNKEKIIEDSIEMLVEKVLENNKTQLDIETSIKQIQQKSNELATIDVIKEALIDILKENDQSIERRHIQNYEIKHYFSLALEKAKQEVCIISPWIANWVISDADIQRRFEKLLSNGVNIKILFGISGTSTSPNDNRRGESTDRAAQALKKKFNKRSYKGSLTIEKVNSHYKLFICDDLFFVESSMNILSNKGDYGEGFEWHEGGTYSEDKKYLHTLKTIYFQ